MFKLINRKNTLRGFATFMCILTYTAENRPDTSNTKRILETTEIKIHQLNGREYEGKQTFLLKKKDLVNSTSHIGLVVCNSIGLVSS